MSKEISLTPKNKNKMAIMTGVRKVLIKNNIKRGRFLKRQPKNIHDLMVITHQNERLGDVLSQELENPVLVTMFPQNGTAYVHELVMDDDEKAVLGWNKNVKVEQPEQEEVQEAEPEVEAEKPVVAKKKAPAKKKTATVVLGQDEPTDEELAEIEASLENL